MTKTLKEKSDSWEKKLKEFLNSKMTTSDKVLCYREGEIDDFIRILLSAEREKWAEEMRIETGYFGHSEFCEKRGKQFKKCLECVLEKLNPSKPQ